MSTSRRVAVVGPRGSGKTAFAGQLAARLGVPQVDLDALHWQPGWVDVPPEALRSRVADLVAGDGWVVDSTGAGELGRLVLDQAGLVLWIDVPRSAVVWRSLRRSLRRSLGRSGGGLRRSTAHPEQLADRRAHDADPSTLRATLRQHAADRVRLAADAAAARPGQTWVCLRSGRGTRAWLALH